jgi:hypothetical protein
MRLFLCGCSAVTTQVPTTAEGVVQVGTPTSFR